MSAFDPLQSLSAAAEGHSLCPMSDVRHAILNSCRQHYCKVAMVFGRASRQLGNDDEETYELLGQEIAKLVEDRHLEAVRDVSKWRHSEVRLPPA